MKKWQAIPSPPSVGGRILCWHSPISHQVAENHPPSKLPYEHLKSDIRLCRARNAAVISRMYAATESKGSHLSLLCYVVLQYREPPRRRIADPKIGSKLPQSFHASTHTACPNAVYAKFMGEILTVHGISTQSQDQMVINIVNSLITRLHRESH